MRLQRAQLVPISLSLRTPLPTAHGVLDARTGFVVGLEATDGHVGWGECLPLPGFGLESPDSAREALHEGIEALRETVAKFIRRFRSVEQRVWQEGKDVSDCPLEVLDAHWNAAKRTE